MTDWSHELALYCGHDTVCGCDEAGRGPLAGPVYAAAVILPRGLVMEGLDDSKKLSEKKREAVAVRIREAAVAFSVAFADVEEIIDRLKDKLIVIVYLSELSAPTALRVKDILSGAIYALGGGMAELERDIYIFNPDGVNADQ